jgi:plastocyanin
MLHTLAPRRLATLVVLPAALVLGVAACGSSSGSGSGGGGSGGGSSSTASTGGAGTAPVALQGKVTNKGTKTLDPGATELEVEADDFYFKPTFVKAAPGQKLEIEIENEGSATHTFTSTALGVDEELSPGAKKTVEVTVPTDGAAGFFCRFHRSQGMQGAIFTVDGQALAG